MQNRAHGFERGPHLASVGARTRLWGGLEEDLGGGLRLSTEGARAQFWGGLWVGTRLISGGVCALPLMGPYVWTEEAWFWGWDTWLPRRLFSITRLNLEFFRWANSSIFDYNFLPPPPPLKMEHLQNIKVSHTQFRVFHFCFFSWVHSIQYSKYSTVGPAMVIYYYSNPFQSGPYSYL